MTFSLDLKKFAEESGLELELVTRKISLDAYSRVTVKTPVDTGRARANWNIGAGSPDLSTTTDTSSELPNVKKGDGERAIYITNNLDYISELEDGSSKQSPNGMVAVTMLELEAGIKNVLR
tara:strand:- start:240 stop:602 length:363 start_codon:yes stop_codon:yes gene_type:complete